MKQHLLYVSLPDATINSQMAATAWAKRHGLATSAKPVAIGAGVALAVTGMEDGRKIAIRDEHLITEDDRLIATTEMIAIPLSLPFTVKTTKVIRYMIHPLVISN